MDALTLYQSLLFYMLFGSVTAISVVACCYLLWRRGNAFSLEITPPTRLRRCTAAFFASIAASHVWWWLFRFARPYSVSHQDVLLCMVFDVVVVMPAMLCVLLVMLQDRRRPLWNVAVVVAVGLIDLAFYGITGDKYSVVCLLIYVVLLLVLLLIMIKAVREYGRWLRQNHADLEHKEVWQAFVLIGIAFAASLVYALSSGSLLSEMLIEVADLVLIGVLLWRVETLQTLEETPMMEVVNAPEEADTALYDKLEALLQEHCIGKQFYLRHDASLTQLARLMGTNTTYLSQHFAQQGLTYNTYINGLRIAHFEQLYQQAVSDKHTVTATELAGQCGFGSYSAFSTAFKQIKGKTVKEWMAK